LWTTGCEKGSAPVSTENGGKEQKAADDHGHEHPSHGPHDGDLIELGDEEYHAEFVHDEKTSDVTIYILDSSAKRPVAIEAKEVTISLKHEGNPEQHKLTADPQEGDERGKASRFVSKKNDELCHAIEEEGSGARLQVTIAGKSFTGDIVHSHDHAGHDHKHDDHDHEEKK
jgi:hypothetical protein